MGRLLTLGILGAISCGTLAAPAWAQTGSVTGTITTSAKGLAPVRVTIDQKVCGNELPDHAIVVDAQGRLANAVVVLTGVKGSAPAETMVTNDKCAFAPRVEIMRPNGNLKTTSNDPVLHTTNAQLENGRTLFNVALPIPGLTITKPIGAAGTVRLGCNTHPWMRGWVIVTDQAAAVTAADGRFTIDNVPPGTYELRVWHEALKGAPQKITVAAGKPADLTVQMK
ncbi:MAG: carboxypeptidase regulatory-like domain-containing protein [Acidobacteriota bacterium]|nr:carboxypeptidase regulatory-like domain-containing protein [Acidobacteriota bacterium]